MIIGKRGSKCRDDIWKAGALKREPIRVTFDEDRGVLRTNVLRRAVEAVEHLPLMKDRRIGAVQIFRLRVVEHSPAKTEAIISRRVDRKNNSIAEQIVVTGFALAALF